MYNYYFAPVSQMPDFKSVSEVASFVANCFTIVTAVIAIYVFKVKGPALAAALTLLLNFSFQTTLGELKEKLERLNEYRAHDAVDNIEIVNIFHELLGQINGNARVSNAMPDVVIKLEKMLTREITEPKKRAMISLIREKLKTMNVESATDMTGGLQ